MPLFCRENLLLDLWQVPDSVEVRQNHFFGQPKCLQGCARTGSWVCSGSMAETVGSSFCRGFGCVSTFMCKDTQPPQVIFGDNIFDLFWSTIYSTKRGWSAGHYAEAIWRLQSVVKLQSKTKEQRKKKKTDETSVGPLQNQQVNEADFYTSNTGFSTKCNCFLRQFLKVLWINF